MLLCFAVERVGWFWFLNLVVVAGWVFVCEFGELLLVACRCVVGCFTGLGLVLVAVWKLDLYGYFDVRLLVGCGVVYDLI